VNVAAVALFWCCNILANEFTVLNYDRRCNSRSTGDRSIDMTVAQQARDVVAIIKAMGSDKAIIFGSSGGGIIGLELAAANPEVIDFLIIHEAPVIELLPAADAEKWRSFHYDIYMKSLSEGWEAALVDFMASIIGAPDIPFPPDLNERVSQNMDFFFKHEYKAFIQYIPTMHIMCSQLGSWHQGFIVNASSFQANMMYRSICLRNLQTPLEVR
jgi:pimeloyl-ACP methyl ester carboxylesterase